MQCCMRAWCVNGEFIVSSDEMLVYVCVCSDVDFLFCAQSQYVNGDDLWMFICSKTCTTCETNLFMLYISSH